MNKHISDIKKNLNSPDEEVRMSSLRNFSSFRDKECINLLNIALGDPSWRIRKEAVNMLIDLYKPDEVIPLFILSLSSHDNAGRRNAALEGLVKIGSKCVDELIKRIDDKDRDVRKFIVDILGEIGDKRGLPYLIKALNDEDENVSIAAAENIGKVGNSDVVDILIEVLNKEKDKPWLRFSISETLSKIGGSIPIEPIIEAAKDKILRKAAFDVVGSSLNPGGIDILIDGINDEVKSSRESAISALIKIYNSLDYKRDYIRNKIESIKDVSMIIESIDSLDHNVRTASIKLLGLSGNINTIPYLIDIAREYKEVRDEAFNSIFEICKNDSKGIELIVGLLYDESPYIRGNISLILGKLGVTEALDRLIELLGDEEKEVADLVAESLIILGRDNPEIISQIKSLLSSKDPALRRNIIKILGNIWSEDEALELLTKYLKDEDAEIRRDAVSLIGMRLKERAIDYVIFALADEDRGVRLEAVNVLGDVEGDKTKELLFTALNDEDIWVRAYAVKSLGKRSGEDVINAIKGMLKDIPPVAITAIEVLKEKLGRDAIEPLIKTLESNEIDIIRASLNALNSLMGDEFVKLINHNNEIVRNELKRLINVEC